MKILSKLRKDKRFRGLSVDDVVTEINEIVSGLKEEQRRDLKIKVNDRNVSSYVLKTLNKATNQRGPGDYRLLVEQGQPYAIAVHAHRGYNIVFQN